MNWEMPTGTSWLKQGETSGVAPTDEFAARRVGQTAELGPLGARNGSRP